jgi:hypothetical protein
MISPRRSAWIAGRVDQGPGNVWDEALFRFLLTSEQRRSKRSGKPFVLTILNAMEDVRKGGGVLEFALPAVVSSVRETDMVGWIEKPSVLGIIFTQLDSARTHPNMTIVQLKLDRALHAKLGPAMLASIAISSHIFTDPLETLQFDAANSVHGQASAIQ